MNEARQPGQRSAQISTILLAAVTLLVLILSVPDSLRDDYKRGNLYVFSRSFIKELPKRMSGPGRFRLIVQPLTAAVLGIRAGLADARSGRPPYILGVLFHRKHRDELLRSSFAIVNVLLVGVLLDSLLQWLIYGHSHPAASLVVGPLLIAAPYSLARALANRCSRLRTSP
jgi:hypothetical protein